MNNNRFRLIGILTGAKPSSEELKEGKKDYFKVLNEHTFYPFYQAFSYDNETRTLNYDPSKDIELYSISAKDLNREKDLNIQLSAIVGKNGSGKSTLLELLYLTVYHIGVKCQILEDPETGKKIRIHIKEKYQLTLKLYFQLETTVYCISINDNQTQWKSAPLNDAISDQGFNENQQLNRLNAPSFLSEIFYSIAVNYSIYGLNDSHIGKWINSLFHKNDAYQTPLVINPKRENGNIEINNEEYLAKSRLLVNILKKNNLGIINSKLTETKDVVALEFTLNKKKIEYVYAIETSEKVSRTVKINFKDFFSYHFKKEETSSKDWVYNRIYKHLFDFETSIITRVKHSEEVLEYIVKKILNISRKYPEYQKYTVYHKIADSETNIQIFNQEEGLFEEYLSILKAKDKSHITFKLKQAINYLKYNYLNFIDNIQNDTSNKWEKIADPNNQWVGKLFVNKETWRYNTSLLELANRLQPKKNTEDPNQQKMLQESLIHLLPPSLFDVSILLRTDNPKQPSSFAMLSSGEQQQIHSVQSLLYHLRNLDSVFDQPKENKPKKNETVKQRITYKNVNIILDEIELYFHPDLQRTFISELLAGIKRLPLKHIEGINLLLATHSPFILSDIPAQNVLRLKDGEPQPYDPTQQTFGANIHDLLANDFFLKDGFMGEFAKGKINDLINFLTFDHKKEISEHNLKPTNNWSHGQVKNFIELIGEPLLKYDLKEMYLTQFYSDIEIDKEIELLQRIKILKSKSNDIN